MIKTRAMNRREFVKASAFGVFGTGILLKSALAFENDYQPELQLKIKEYRTLGRTGFKVSDISCGIYRDIGLLNAVLDTGVNYIDTAESYGNEHILGQAIQNRNRKSLFITTKLLIRKDVSKQGFLKRAKKCLERLNTDYIDCMMIHSCPDVETLKTEGFHAAMTELKAQGRLRFLGVSNHGVSRRTEPKVSMEKVFLAAAEDGRFDVFLMAYNFLNENNGAKVLRVCKEKNIGATLMKVNPVLLYQRIKENAERLEKEGKDIDEGVIASLNRLKGRTDEIQPFVKKYNLENQSEIRKASIKWALNNPDISTVCCRFQNYTHLEEYVPLSGTRLTAMDARILAAYNKDCGYTYCRHACGECEPECPENVPVNTIMRFNHYFVAQGREKEAMLKYAALKTPKAARCKQCSGHCETVCPYGVPIQGLLALAHNRLTHS
ncbi:MAG: aldo/keto reductase [Candidatus Aminicenantes bacterium]|nr:MAG: aldo/keto reductase [Candidatus Aminicenantes bacterium]